MRCYNIGWRILQKKFISLMKLNSRDQELVKQNSRGYELFNLNFSVTMILMPGVLPAGWPIDDN